MITDIYIGMKMFNNDILGSSDNKSVVLKMYISYQRLLKSATNDIGINLICQQVMRRFRQNTPCRNSITLVFPVCREYSYSLQLYWNLIWSNLPSEENDISNKSHLNHLYIVTISEIIIYIHIL